MIRQWVWMQWHRRTWMWLLWPLACIYAACMKLRSLCYRYGLLASHRLPVPVWVVGNLSVGGTGKTALVIHLVAMLKQQGLRAGIISRGYGGKVSSVPRVVSPSGDAAVVGDEALLIVTKTDCPMVVCRDRVLAARTLLKHHDCDVLISDDGLQHLALERDVEIVVVDDQRLFGNGWCIPAGPLRESASRANHVDLLVYHGQTKQSQWWMRRCCRSLARLGQPDQCRMLNAFKGAEIQVMTAIGDPERLCQDLKSVGLTIGHTMFFPDHHVYQHADLDGLKRGMPVLATEKDAIKMSKIRTDHEIWVLKEVLELSEPLKRQFASFFAILNMK